MFSYSGPLHSSKSIVLRSLIVSSFFPKHQLLFNTESQDVLDLKNALEDIKKPVQKISFGAAPFRFLALRLSRQVGEFIIQGEDNLFSRPHQTLTAILNDLGVQTDWGKRELKIKSNGWIKPEKELRISNEISSQFASAFLLNCLDWPQLRNNGLTIRLDPPGAGVSNEYLQMTIRCLKQWGARMETIDSGIFIPPDFDRHLGEGSMVLAKCETDMSSAFTFAACAAVGGDLVLNPFLDTGLQPDHVFLELFNRMGILCENRLEVLKVSKAKKINSFDFDFKNTPDLFPVMCGMLSFAQGTSLLTGFHHIQFKESDRLERTIKLLKEAGVSFELEKNFLKIFGQGIGFKPRSFTFDPFDDHRMVFAAALFKIKNPEIKIQNSSAVRKSIPDFWKAFPDNFL